MAAKSRAEKLATKIWEESGKMMPVDVVKIATMHKIRVHTEDLEDDVSGMMVTCEDGSVSIVVNSGHHKNRHRFSIAHELGHYFLHRAMSPIFVDSNKVFFRDARAAEGNNKQEIEANAFAAELLMPETKVRQYFPSSFSLMEVEQLADDIEKVAKKFGVSSAALSIRLHRLGILVSAE
ncbi:MAG: ImmA/IrrE family metallo-endopeptidase [Candidatus Obscuribacterales bacterium]|nr:ImmA/IrrE family metallo-endopeptidase [Candidatus Obscuribacterales bacterium]